MLNYKAYLEELKGDRIIQRKGLIKVLTDSATPEQIKLWDKERKRNV